MNKRILVVEDDSGIRDTMQMMLEQESYEVELHRNGDALLKNDFRTPALFILDKQLPGIDGLDLCTYLKSQLTTRHIPVIVLSASPHAALLAEKAGANGFLEKPFSRRDLLSLIADLLGR